MLKLAELNAMPRSDFTKALGGIFEHSPWVVEKAADQRPFATVADLEAALRNAVARSSDAEKIALIRAHPDLVGNATLTAESSREQAAAGLGDLSTAEVQQFRTYNTEYRRRFGFPFVICARLNKKDAILAAFPVRLQNSREEEIETALGEIFKIAELRLKDLVA